MTIKKIKFSISSNNQLTFRASSRGKKEIIKGKFKVSNNNLAYLINETSKWRRRYNISQKLVLKGKWKLDNNHNLVLDLQKTEKFNKSSVSLNGKITKVDGNYLIFKIKSKKVGNKENISYLKLRGSWRSDRFNRIIFDVTKKEKPDTLVFKSIWQLNKAQKITYKYEKTYLKTKAKSSSELVFDGFWQINKRNRLKYLLAGNKSSFFDFRVYSQSNNLYPKRGAIKYRIGIGAKEEKRSKIISLYGNWKFSRGLGLTFEMDYGEGQISRIYFNSTINLNKKNKVIFVFKGIDNKPLGFTLTFKRNILPKKELEYFLQMKKQEKDLYLGFGVTSRF